MSESAGDKAICQGDVIAAERAAILRARGDAEGAAGADSGDKDFVGVSNSGGGVRAGAVSLGFLMGLHEQGLLRFVDYLSTVSGGGYAGAVLTAERAAAQDSQDQSRCLFGDRAGASGARPTVPGGLARLRELVAQCNYLIRNQSWMSRALLGVAAMGTVSICAMIFVTAFLAWFFRLLYLPPVLEFLKVLGFEGDLVVPMTPACGMFLLWLLCWCLSFFRHYRKATGRTAAYVFRGFLFCVVLGVTMIAVTGDVDVEQFMRHTGVSKDLWQQVAGLGGWLKSGILALIGASLIPYFRPSALLRSGRERAAGPKKFLFILARNGLLLGIPLISFGILAREDISAWNRDRDYRFEFKDLLSVLAPFTLETGPELLLFREFERVQQRGPDAGKPLENLQTFLAGRLFTGPVRDEWENYRWLQREYEVLNAGGSDAAESVQLSRLNLVNERSRLERLAMLLGHLLVWEQPSAEGSAFARMRYLLSEMRKSQRKLMFLLNTAMLDPDFVAAIHQNRQDLAKSQQSGSAATAASSEEILKIEAMYERLWSPFGGAAKRANCKPYVRLVEQMASSEKRLKDAGESGEAGDISEILEVPASLQPLYGLMWEGANGDRRNDFDTERFLSSLLKCNHLLVAAAFPGAIRKRDDSAEIFSSVVHTRDQEVRWSIMVWSFWVALVLSAVCDLNSLSWHGFYSRQLGMFWIRAGYENYTELTLKVLAGKGLARPLHLMNAAVCLTGEARSGDQGYGDNPDHFLISPMFCGSARGGIGFVDTGKSLYGDLQLSDAIALSGAALSPWATNNPLVRVLLLVLNLRTGLWLPNPAKITRGALQRRSWDIIDRHLFSPLRWLALRFVPAGTWTLQARAPEQWSHLLVTDGGHYENLGIESLLQRRCRLIVAVDASEDANYEFQGLATVMNRARIRDGLQFFDADSRTPFQFPTRVVPDEKTGYSAERIVAIRVEYPERNGAVQEGLLLIVKSALLSSDPFELQQHRKEYSAFPNDPTSDQFFAPDKFEAYRFLGFTAACQMAERLGLSKSSNAQQFIEAVRLKYFGASDPAKLPGELEATLKEYVNSADGEPAVRDLGQRKLLRILELLEQDSRWATMKPEDVLPDGEWFAEALRDLQRNVFFRSRESVLKQLLRWLQREPSVADSSPRGLRRARRGSGQVDEQR